MKPSEHVAKAERIMASLRSLRTPCQEMEIEGRMLAGTHLVNAVLHRRGVLESDIAHAWGVQSAGYGWEMDRVLRLLSEIEGLRPLFVRGCEPDADRGVLVAEAAYRELENLLSEAMPATA